MPLQSFGIECAYSLTITPESEQVSLIIVNNKYMLKVESLDTTVPDTYEYELVMTPEHDMLDYASDLGPWNFPIEVKILERPAVVVNVTEEQEQAIAVTEKLNYPPTLVPLPPTIVTVLVGYPLDLYVGEPTSFKNNEIEVKVNVKGSSFIRFDESSNRLSIGKGVTKQQDVGMKKVQITLKDVVDELITEYEIKIMIFAVESEDEADSSEDQSQCSKTE